MMPSPGIVTPTDIRHLGVLVGEPDADRIIAVSTSAVFDDISLPQMFWGVADTAMDSGFQGHMYTRPNDIQVVRVPRNDDAVPQMVLTAIGVNHEIWKSHTGIELSSATSRLVLASDHPSPPTDALPENLSWRTGSLLDAAASRYRTDRVALLAFVLSDRLATMLGLSGALLEQARTTSRLMDKNIAMQALQENGIDCARTYPFNEDTDFDETLSRIPAGRYLFKPAGGAAGIGLYGNLVGGVDRDVITAHVRELRRMGRLPARFQIQEFLRGTPYGVTAWFDDAQGTFAILDIHRQDISDAGRFVGGRWTRALQAAQMESADALCHRLAAIELPRFSKLICLDVIDRRIIEINPRLTASAPIAHLLRRQDQIARHLGRGFRIRQLDLNSRLQIPYKHIRNGTLVRLIDRIRRERGVLVLPQGLNPFGDSRIVFVNDDREGTGQRTFIQLVGV